VGVKLCKVTYMYVHDLSQKKFIVNSSNRGQDTRGKGLRYTVLRQEEEIIDSSNMDS